MCHWWERNCNRRRYFYYSFLFQQSLFILFLFASFCFKGYTQWIFFTAFGSRLQNKLNAEWNLRSYLSSHGCRDKSTGTAWGHCHRFGCWCKKWNGTRVSKHQRFRRVPMILLSPCQESSCLPMSIFAVLASSVLRALSIRFFWEFNSLSSSF